jgi:hypothetical protein
MAFPPSVEFWRQHLEGRSDAPMDFLLAYIQRESGGNRCSTGFTGPQNFEAGIGQIFFQNGGGGVVNGVTLAQLRSGCNGQTPTRAPTAEDIEANVSSFLIDIENFRAKSHAQLSGAGAPWDDEALEDFWMLVKMQHNLPAVPVAYLRPAVEANRCNSFREWKDFVLGLSFADLVRIGNEQQPGFGTAVGRFAGQPLANVFRNAELTGEGKGVTIVERFENLGPIVPVAALVLLGLVISKGGLA